MRMTWTRPTLALLLSLLLTACGGDDTDTSTADADPSSAGDAAAAEDPGSAAGATDDGGDDPTADATDDGGDAPAASGGAGTLVLGDETITLDRARCFLEEQDAAAGGGKILFVGQAFGTNAAGEELVLDVSRYDEDSQFAGDDIIIDIGDWETGVSWQVSADLGTVQVSGASLSAADLTLTNWDDFSEMPGSFEINC